MDQASLSSKHTARERSSQIGWLLLYHCVRTCIQWTQCNHYTVADPCRGRSQGATDPPFQSVALVQLLASYLSVFVAIVV